MADWRERTAAAGALAGEGTEEWQDLRPHRRGDSSSRFSELLLSGRRLSRVVYALQHEAYSRFGVFKTLALLAGDLRGKGRGKMHTIIIYPFLHSLGITGHPSPRWNFYWLSCDGV
jgi:hypothetical protein